MMRSLWIVALMALLTLSPAIAQSGLSENQTVRGWLSDEQCARGRASSGAYTGTNPRCAKDCIAKGRKIVLIEPDKKMILLIENQSAARQHIGDYVEVTGALAGGSLHIESVKMLDKGVASCERPTLQRQ
jgi:hypothetical protein